MKITNEYLRRLIKEGLKVKLNKNDLDEAVRDATPAEVAAANDPVGLANVAAGQAARQRVAQQNPNATPEQQAAAFNMAVGDAAAAARVAANLPPAAAPAAFAAPAAPAPVAPKDRSGMTPEAKQVTKQIQKALGLAEDGVYGTATEQAVNQWFKDHPAVKRPGGKNFLEAIKNISKAISTVPVTPVTPVDGDKSSKDSTEEPKPAVISKGEIAPNDLQAKVDIVVDDIDGYVDQDNIKSIYDNITALEGYTVKGKPAISEFIRYYKTDEDQDLISDLESIGTKTFNQSAIDQLNDIKEIVKKYSLISAPVAPVAGAPGMPSNFVEMREGKFKLSKLYLQKVIKEELIKVLNEEVTEDEQNFYAKVKVDPADPNVTNTALKAGTDMVLAQVKNNPNFVGNFLRATTQRTSAAGDYTVVVPKEPRSQFNQETAPITAAGGRLGPPAAPATPTVKSPKKAKKSSPPRQDVANLQKVLLSLKFLPKNGVDGILGMQTYNAFQEAKRQIIQKLNDVVSKEAVSSPKTQEIRNLMTRIGQADFTNTDVSELGKLYTDVLLSGYVSGTGGVATPKGKIDKQFITKKTPPVVPVVPTADETNANRYEPSEVSAEDLVALDRPSTANVYDVNDDDLLNLNRSTTAPVYEGKVRFSKKYIDQVIKEEYRKELKKKIYKSR